MGGAILAALPAGAIDSDQVATNIIELACLHKEHPMYKHILIPATGTDADADNVVFATALQAARPGRAHLEFLHVKADVTAMLMAMTTGGLGGGVVAQDILDKMEAEVEAGKQKAWDHFAAFCKTESIATGADAPGLSAELAVETGREADWLVDYGRAADLIVVGRNIGIEAMEAILMDSGRPLLIAAAKPPRALSGTVAIAWKDTPEAARAVTAAMPLIEQAARVVILSVNEGSAAQRAGSKRLCRSLLRRNPATELLQLSRGGQPAVDVLLAEAARLDAGLLVMGGYSHSRLRQAVFGGFTKHILSGADLTVLMAH
jgi:nucleotide-binding universal stress UspA family protein